MNFRVQVLDRAHLGVADRADLLPVVSAFDCVSCIFDHAKIMLAGDLHDRRARRKRDIAGKAADAKIRCIQRIEERRPKFHTPFFPAGQGNAPVVRRANDRRK